MHTGLKTNMLTLFFEYILIFSGAYDDPLIKGEQAVLETAQPVFQLFFQPEHRRRAASPSQTGF